MFIFYNCNQYLVLVWLISHYDKGPCALSKALEIITPALALVNSINDSALPSTYSPHLGVVWQMWFNASPEDFNAVYNRDRFKLTLDRRSCHVMTAVNHCVVEPRR